MSGKKNNHNQAARRSRAAPATISTSLAGIVAAFGVVVLLAAATHQRNVVWGTKLTLWSDVTAKSPGKSRAHNNLGNCYMLLQKPFYAIEAYRRAVALDPGNLEAYYNLGINLENVGILNQAVYYYRIFCRSAPPGYRQQREVSCERVAALSEKMQ